MPQRARGETQSGRRGARQSRAEGARARESGAWRSGGREAAEPPTHSIADGTALRNIVGEEVAATFGSLEIRLGASLFVSLGAGGILSTTCDDYLLACPSFLSLVPLRSTKIFGGEKSLFFLLFLSFFFSFSSLLFACSVVLIASPIG